MSGSVFFVVIIFLALMGTYVKNAQITHEFVKEKAKINVEIGRLTKTQMEELNAAQNVYFKTYRQYPSNGIDELIAKGFLRANFKDTRLSKVIKLDANNSIKINDTDFRNNTVKSYINAHQQIINASSAKEKSTQTEHESIDNFIDKL